MKIFAFVFAIWLAAASVAAQPSASENSTGGTSALEVIEERLRPTREEARKRRVDFKNTISQKREKLKEKARNGNAELQNKAKAIPDDRKRVVVENIGAGIADLNDRMVAHAVKILDKITNMMARVSRRADKEETRGVDVSSVRAAVSKAASVIDKARAAISVQADKTYTIDVNAEPALKDDTRRTREALHFDLRVMRNVVGEAHDAVRAAAKALAKVSGASKLPEKSKK